MKLILGPFETSNANLAASDFVAGIPSPMAPLGYVGALLRKVGKPTWNMKVLPIFHEIQISSGRIKPEPKPDMTPADLPESLCGRVIFTIYAEIPEAVSLSRLQDAVIGMRFAGGATFPAFGRRWAECVREHHESTLGMRSFARGWALIPPVGRDGARTVAIDERRDFERLADILFPDIKTPGSGYLVAAPVGYRIATEAEPRKASRSKDIPHAFAEPCTGIAEIVSCRNPRIAQAGGEDLAASLWQWRADEPHRHLMFSDFHLSCI